MLRFDASGGIIGDQRSQFLSAVEAFMMFVEDSYAAQIDKFGRQPFEEVTMMHKATKVFIESHALWRAGNKEKGEARTKNKEFKDLHCPNDEHKVLLKYKEMLAGPDLRDGLKNLYQFAVPEAKPPSDREFVEIGNC